MFDSKEYHKNYYIAHKKELIEASKKWNKSHKKNKDETNHKYYKIHKTKIRKQQDIYKKENPWIMVWNDINKRCNNPKNQAYHRYGGRDIKNLFKSADEIKFLWERDNASIMKKTSLHRINNDDSYYIENCIFIEFSDHARFHRNKRPKNLNNK